MQVNAMLSTAGKIDMPIDSGKLNACQHLPTPFFLINKDLELLEANFQAETAIERHWIGVSVNKLHFNSRLNDLYVKRIIESLFEERSENSDESIYSESFVLRSLDNVCRTYVLSRESECSENLVLTIYGDISKSPSKISTLSRAFSLSKSESRIVSMMVNGLKPKEIAYEAGISLNTVRSHLRTLYAKMQVRDYNDALTLAVRLMV